MESFKKSKKYRNDNDLTPEMKELLNPKHSALLVIDKQKAYCDPNEVLSRHVQANTDRLQEMLPLLDGFIENSRELGVPIIWTRMIEDLDSSLESIKIKMRIEETPAISKPGTSGFEYIGMGPIDGEKEVIKKSYDAFAQTDLDAFLRANGVRTIILVGAYASRCVLSTAVGGNGQGYNVFIARDLVGNPSVMAEEEPIAMQIVNAILGFTLHSSQILSAWSEKSAATKKVFALQDLKPD